MTIPNLNLSVNNTNQAAYSLNPIPANPLVVEPMCSWRLSDPQLELEVSNDGENIRYSVYNHHSSIRDYWPNSASSPTHLTSLFAHCVWKGIQGKIESRLFSNNHMAVLLSVNLETEKIGIKWTKSFNNFLITGDPVISAVNDDNSLEFQEEIRENPRNRPYDPKAEEGMTRWRRTKEGDLVMFEGKPVTEETMKVWSGNKDIHLIKFINGLKEEIICRAFSWENKENLQVRYKFAPASAKPCLPNVDAIIQCVKEYTPEIENVKKKGEMIFYKEHPLNCFMPDYDLSATEAIDIQKWVYNRLCHKNGQYFGYTNFVTAKKMPFSFGYGVRRQDGIKKPPEISAWHIEIKRQAGWVLKFFINIRDFFSGIFWASTQEPSEADKKVMKNLLQGVPLLDEERNTIVNDFAIKLGASSTINFYIACDRSEFQLEINGRARIKSFAS